MFTAFGNSLSTKNAIEKKVEHSFTRHGIERDEWNNKEFP